MQTADATREAEAPPLTRPAPPAPDPARYVIISGYHDYRSKRRANLHFDLR